MADTILGANGNTYTVNTSSAAVQSALNQIAQTIASQVVVNINAGPINWNSLPANGVLILTGTNTVGFLLSVPKNFSGTIINATSGGGDVQLLGGTGKYALISGDNNTTALVKKTNPNAQISFTVGDGNNYLDPSQGGQFNYQAGSGNDTIVSMDGTATINAGTGNNLIQTGKSTALINVTGNDTIIAADGTDTILVSGGGSAMVQAGRATLQFAGGSSASTVLGGSGGNDTIFAGDGGGYFQGGARGDNFMRAGTGAATLIGGGDGDFLTASANSTKFTLIASDGNQTLTAGGASIGGDFTAGSGNDLILGGSGADTFHAGAGRASMFGGAGNDLFSFANDATHGGTNIIVQDFTIGQDKIGLDGYGADAIAKALASAKVSGGAETIKLADGTRVTFLGVTMLHTTDFVGIASGGGSGGHDDDGHDKEHGYGLFNDD